MTPRSVPDLQAIEARFAARLGAGLTERAEQLPHDFAERLRVAREQAVARAAEMRKAARQPQAAVEPQVMAVGGGGVALALLGRAGADHATWWQRLAAVLPLLVLVCGLLLIQRQTELEQVHAAAEVDTMLLADDLPPDAYTDPGFGEFLREPPP